ncbi:dicarboxylate/amino acid:cation symporter [Chitinophaga sp. LS1]|uniref:dicarboxylate/amino acid:cation symporter n=1 Tax=Chitinophaga sp. LS1 TaxID=3051176 RepID=UPI002AAA7762|nr:dicarboxylate/amino acid:cation symporter [Chitinophaga sp. LS1]WPV69533.1 dicarboxylate/amino acid:cation symporter [Chitinophaga sp. LS1]
MKKTNRLTLYIFIAMVLGILTGYLVNIAYSGKDGGQVTVGKFVENVSILTSVFLRLVKMIIAPLVFTTLVVGIAKLGDIKAVGRIGGKTMLWFITATFVSLFLGLILVNILKPGADMHLVDKHADTGIKAADMTLRGFFEHVFPDSVVNAMAHNEILQIVIFALFFGVATAAVGELGQIVIKFLDSVAHIMLKVTGYVMNFAPFAVFGAMAATIAEKGAGILKTYGIFIGEFYMGLGTLWLVLAGVGCLILGKRGLDLLKRIKNPALLAFSTASSEAAYPKVMEELEGFGADNRIVSFVLPLGYSFNLDGSMMYMTFASLFIAQAYDMHLGIEQQFSMLLVLMITSKGIAGVPRASLVVIAGTLSMFKIPDEGLLLLLGVDHLLDMGRSATNVIGNAMATGVVSKWEGALAEPRTNPEL